VEPVPKMKNIKVNLQSTIYNLQSNKGFIALITVLIIFAIVLLVGLSISLLSINEAQMGLKKSQSSQAYFLANLCAENALMKLKENINYSGNETIEIEGGSCQILPIEGKWIIKTISNFQNQVKKIKIIVSQVNPQMLISSWQEVADF
jgi:nitrate/TMAO reductase-like tetraheme cytochrome c subunit